MAKYKLKTTETDKSVAAFLKKQPPQRQDDSKIIIDIMQKESGFEPKMWGPSIIGFGSVHYKYESGHEGDAPIIAFSPRKAYMVLYLASEFEKKEELLKKFGKHKVSKACIYFNKIADIDTAVMRKMISNSLKNTNSNGC